MWKPFSALITVALIAGCQAPRPIEFGIMADIQYADKEPSGIRHYRTSLDRLQTAVDELNEHDLAFTIQLGDIIDGNEPFSKMLSDLLQVLESYGRLSAPRYHVIGNHCLYATELALHWSLNLPEFYYDFTSPKAPGWRFIVMNGNDAGYGALGPQQLDWLKNTLRNSRPKRREGNSLQSFSATGRSRTQRIDGATPACTGFNQRVGLRGRLFCGARPCGRIRT